MYRSDTQSRKRVGSPRSVSLPGFARVRRITVGRGRSVAAPLDRGERRLAPLVRYAAKDDQRRREEDRDGEERGAVRDLSPDSRLERIDRNRPHHGSKELSGARRPQAATTE